MEFKPEKKLGFGLMRLPQKNPNDAADIDLEQVKAMVDLFMERGFTYFDTAWMYCGFASEDAARVALVERYPRESFTLATKLHDGFIETEADRDKIFNAQLEKTGAGYFDYYLIHGIEEDTIGKYESLHCFEWLLEKKRAGLVRHAGFSFHASPELLDRLLTQYPEMEFVQLQINYLDWESPWILSWACYEVAVRHGKQVIVMEPVKGGTLARLPEEAAAILRALDENASPASWAVRFAAGLENVMVVLSGMSSVDQVRDNTGYMADFKPLTEEEKAACFRAAEVIRSQIAVPCTGCSYCTEGCPMHIAIPQYFSLYNEEARERRGDDKWTINFSSYEHLTRTYGKPGDCIGCGQCEGVCPQHLPITDYLRKVAEYFEE